MFIVFLPFLYVTFREPGQCSQYSNWLRAGQPRDRSSSPRGNKNFHFSMSSRQALRPTQPPIQWVPGALSMGVKQPGREAGHSPPATAKVKEKLVCTVINNKNNRLY
jgi:hypothetical protein